ncbi:hypothetical protein Tco_1094532 [Tanacetum coccineum]|uniref:Uncharacterized protein n=1 Tax=Tanacetum coccineum TaxID=301880 RepID=A0ABQ5IH43_9ASTR
MPIPFFVDEPTEVELKELLASAILEYAFLEATKQVLPVIMQKFDVEEKFRSHKDSYGRNYAPAVHIKNSKSKNPDVIKREVEKHLESGLNLPYLRSPWVSRYICVPKKGKEDCGQFQRCRLVNLQDMRLRRRWSLYDTSRSLEIFPNCLSPFRPDASKVEDNQLKVL